jgi:lipoprotein-anchoring transpeptidase ErfK/SrfK
MLLVLVGLLLYGSSAPRAWAWDKAAQRADVLSDPEPPLPDAILKGLASENPANISTGVGGPIEIKEEMQSSAARRGLTSIRPNGVGATEHWIDVDLGTQTLVAYEGDTPVLTSAISSGMAQWPTVTGQFRTWMKHETQDMSGYHLGYNYYLPDVPYVMYFFQDYAIHGAYWHNNFGTPMSHGCVNMNPADAGWLFAWAPLGTLVNVHD